MLLDTLFPEFYTNDPSYNTVRSIPYNLIKLSDTELYLEFNVAGIDEADLDIEVKENTLKVSGNPKRKDAVEYVVNRLNFRPFSNTFTLRDNFEVKSAKVKNGILTVSMELIVPEEKKPRKILLTH
ncbi:IbpA Molecular chaperone (small heat shock protein) [uncultured Caudovirales phage]|uniref:IbpA Molecular chaperone (Small heat shock protein) n=1 Tax=uncultured Caudovirales phage TaxID=2100421 RepID=A0A6J5M809_9CAUD|nr:IbpA Molecular chaperone (small heat shock protein) [uncultured Caudovirales phage]